MAPLRILLLCSCVALTLIRPCKGHGFLMDPPARSSLWREGFNSPRNYNDNQLNCGGYFAQYGLNRGKCGICGDNYAATQPRDNESGGKFGNGIIARTYTEGQVVHFKVKITANHLGWMEFRICPNGSPNTPVTQSCLDQYLLPLADGSGTRYDLGTQINVVSVDVKLPPGLTCKQCVIQWRWVAGNNFGTDASGRQCKGCGPQEEFRGCADVEITGSNAPSGVTPAHVTYAPITNQPPVFTGQPFTFQPITASTPQVYPTFQPITYQPLTNAPIGTPKPTNPQVFPTFQPINFPVFTNAPTTQQPVTQRPFQPITYTPKPQVTYGPIATVAPNQLPSGFLPLNPQPTQTPAPTFQPITFRPQTSAPTFQPITFRPQTSAPTFQPFTFRPRTTSLPFQTITFRPQTQVPTYRPIATFRPQTPSPTFQPITFRPQSTVPPIRTITFAPMTTPLPTFQPIVTFRPQTPSPQTPAPTFYRPPTTAQPVRTLPTYRPPVTFQPITFAPVTPSPTSQPIIFHPQTPAPTFYRPPSTAQPFIPPVTNAPTQSPTTQKTTRLITFAPIVINLGQSTTSAPFRMTIRPNPITAAPQATTLQPVTTATGKQCFAVNSWAGLAPLDQWCQAKCNAPNSSCPPEYCACR